ncbi:hypothetical protein [Burkholderia ubonensis]|nr:hypothetical protein [Burkholderia ubonensis]
MTRAIGVGAVRSNPGRSASRRWRASEPVKKVPRVMRGARDAGVPRAG